MPVVCLDIADALNYPEWLMREPRAPKRLETAEGELVAESEIFAGMPTQNQWNLGAFGTMYPELNSQVWLQTSNDRHDRASAPAPVDRTGSRDNRIGLADVIGNVWEWCFDPTGDVVEAFIAVIDASQQTRDGHCSLSGGGYLDDMTRIFPFVNEWQLKDGRSTRHSDVGIRLVIEIPLPNIDEDLRERLSECEVHRGESVAAMPVTA